MKSKLLSFSLFSLTALSPFFIPSLTPSASAGCVGVSAGAQVAISKNPSQQGTTVNREFGKDCNGNSAVSTGSQVCFNDSGSCNQRRNVNQRIDGSGYNRTGVKTPNINVDVNPSVKVRLPHNYPSGR